MLDEARDRLRPSHPPDWLVAFAKGAKAEGFKVIIAGAGGAAHSAGHDRGHDHASGVRRAGPLEGAVGHRPAGQSFDRSALHRPDAGRRPGRDARDRGARARSTPPCSPPPCWRWVTTRWRGAPRGVAGRSARPRSPSAPGAPQAPRPPVDDFEPRRDDRVILGAGQLGRMLAIAALLKVGLRTHIFAPEAVKRRPGDAAAARTVAEFEDEAALSPALLKRSTWSPSSSRTCRHRRSNF